MTQRLCDSSRGFQPEEDLSTPLRSARDDGKRSLRSARDDGKRSLRFPSWDALGSVDRGTGVVSTPQEGAMRKDLSRTGR